MPFITGRQPIYPPSTNRADSTSPTPGTTSPTAPTSPGSAGGVIPPSDGFLSPVAGSGGTGRVVSLGTVDGKELSIAADGRLELAGAQGSLDDTLAAHRAALKNISEKNPFQSCDNAVLLNVAERLAATHQGGLAEPIDDKHQLDLRQLRGGSLALLEAAAVRAGELGNTALRDRLVTLLVKAAEAEPFRALRDFACESMVARASEGTLPSEAVAAAQESIYPSKPPYDKWLKDGVVKVAYYVDNDGSPVTSTQAGFRNSGYTETKIDDENWLYVQEGTPKVEIRLHAPKNPHDNENKSHLLEMIDDPSVDIISYAGHAGYGHRVEDAINRGAKGTGQDKLIVLNQCMGDTNIESLERAFPDAQLISTTSGSKDSAEQQMFRTLLFGVRAQKDWNGIQRDIIQGQKFFVGAASRADDPEKQYFFPNTRTVLAGRYDRDRDGVADIRDRVFNVIYSKRLAAAGGLDPVAQAVAPEALDGRALSKAKDALGLVIQWNQLLPSEAAAKVNWGPYSMETNGFFTPSPGDEHAFKFTRDPVSKKLKVQVSTLFAHTSEKDLTRMAAFEAGLHMGKEAGLNDQGQVALGLTMLDRATRQQQGWFLPQTLLDEPWVEETLLLKRYGLEGMDLTELANALPADDLKPKDFEKALQFVAAHPGLEKAARKDPTRVGTPVEVPSGLRLAAAGLTNEGVTRILGELGFKGTVTSFGPNWLAAGEPNNVVAVLRDAEGKTFQVGLSLDDEGAVVQASQIELELDRVKDRAGAEYLARVAQAVKKSPSELVEAFTKKRSENATVSQAVAAVLLEQKGSVPSGTQLPGMDWVSNLITYGLATRGEYKEFEEALDQLSRPR